jgi:hypothetical protein
MRLINQNVKQLAQVQVALDARRLLLHTALDALRSLFALQLTSVQPLELLKAHYNIIQRCIDVQDVMTRHLVMNCLISWMNGSLNGRGQRLLLTFVRGEKSVWIPSVYLESGQKPRLAGNRVKRNPLKIRRISRWIQYGH